MFGRRRQPPRAPIAAARLLRPRACAGCLAESTAADALLAMLVGEAVTDPDARDELRATHGWCASHLERAVRIATADGGRSSIAILYADILRTLDIRGARWPTPHPVCGVCAYVVETLPPALTELSLALTRGEHADAFPASGPLCLTHTAAVAALPRSVGRDMLLAHGMAELRATAADLQDFADRQDHRSSDRTDHGSIERLLTFVRGSDGGSTANRARRP